MALVFTVVGALVGLARRRRWRWNSAVQYRRLSAAYRSSAASAGDEPAVEVSVGAPARQFADAVEVEVGGRAADVTPASTG